MFALFCLYNALSLNLFSPLFVGENSHPCQGSRQSGEPKTLRQAGALTPEIINSLQLSIWALVSDCADLKRDSFDAAGFCAANNINLEETIKT
jgi:hypothetical protein